MSFLKISVQEGFTQHKTEYDLFIVGTDGKGNEVGYGDWRFSGMLKKVACVIDPLHKNILAECVSYDDNLVKAMAEHAVAAQSLYYWSSADPLINWNLLSDSFVVEEIY